MCKLLASVIAVRGIICGNWSYQITPQPVADGLSIYSEKFSDLIFHRLQCIGTVPWIDGRYHFRVLVGFPHVPLVIHCADLGNIDICVRAHAPNPFDFLI